MSLSDIHVLSDKLIEIFNQAIYTNNVDEEESIIIEKDYLE